MVLLTDGENTRGVLDPRTAAEAAAAFGIRIYTIGVGTEGEARMPIGRGVQGQLRYQTLPVRLDEPLLRDIAQITGGRYFRATDPEALSRIFGQIDRLEKTPVVVTRYAHFEEGFRLPLLIGLGALTLEEINRAMLYSPVEGIAEVRQTWRRWQRCDIGEPKPSTLPIVTVGLTHGLSLIADLFAGPGRPIAVPTPFWGNYRQTFATRTGAEMVTAPAYRDGRYNCEAIAEALAARPLGEGAVAILNLPSNPGGYAATTDERRRIRDSLLAVAAQRPLLVVCDDAYAGLVYEDDVPARSMFWDERSPVPLPTFQACSPRQLDGSGLPGEPMRTLKRSFEVTFPSPESTSIARL